MNRNEFREKYPQLEIGCVLLSHEEYSKGAIFIGMDRGTEIKMVYLNSFGYSAMNICGFSEATIDKVLKGKHTIYKQVDFQPALVLFSQ